MASLVLENSIRPPVGAVFLSYASQDVVAALRICHALRAAGVEVWLDQEGGLVGGDAWDRKLREQIATCVLFIAIISASTQARKEGYFRLEWKLAAQRTHMMSERTAFLLPVVIDATRDADADVPVEFRAVQWTRLSGGETSIAFCARVTQLLGGGAVVRSAGQQNAPSSESSPRERAGHRPALPQPSRASVWIWTAIAAVAALAFWQALKSKAPPPQPGAETKSSAGKGSVDLASAKSVAVLAFSNLSDDKGNEYFSDGISEELLNVLAKVPKLKVAARTSSFYFKGQNVPIQEIAEKLGVAYVVEGSVRKAGDKVRITAQLIKAADGFHVWSETYDRDLKDIFAVQDEIAKNILMAVKGSLMGEAELPHATTTKIEAYTLYLQAQGAFAKRGDANLREAIRLFEAALAIDSDYVPALVGLGQARAVVPLYANLSGAKARVMIDSAMAAAKRALELDARNPAAHAIIGWLLVQYEWKWSDGEAAVRRALELAPNDAWIWNSLGDHYRFIGEFAKAIAAKQRAWDLDPLSPVSQWDLGYANLVAGNFDLALHWSEVSVGLAPHNLDSYTPGIMAAGQAGRAELMRRLVTAARQNVHENEGLLLLLEARTAIQEKKSDEARRLLAKATPLAETGDTTPAFIGYCYLLLGDADQAASWLQRAYEQRDPALVWNEIIDLDVIAANPKTRPILDRPGIKELYELRQRNARASAGKL